MTDEPNETAPESERPSAAQVGASAAAAPETADSAASAEDAHEPADSDASAESKPTPEPAAPKKPAPVVRRQSVVMRTGSCDMRVGTGALEQLGQATRIAAGKPNRALLVHGDDVAPKLVEECGHLLTDSGFRVCEASVAAGRASRTLENVSRLYAAMAENGITSDDPVVVVGDADVISTLVFVGVTWHTGCPVVAVATTLDGVTDVTVTPRAIDVPGASDMLVSRGNVRFMIADPSVFAASRDTDGELMGRAVMVAGAVAAGENSFNELAVRADGVIAAEESVLVDAILDITKSRARVASSSALAMRQGVLYGLSIGRALERAIETQGEPDERHLVETAPGRARLLAEGLRIAARLAAARQAPDDKLVDFVFTQDALLDKFGLTEVACDIDPVVLLECIRRDELSRSNRCMLALPLGLGRVRLTSVPDDMLSQHLAAWCKSRRKLARRRAREAEAVAAKSQHAGDDSARESAAPVGVAGADFSDRVERDAPDSE